MWCMISKNRYKYQSLLDFAGHHIYVDNRDDVEYHKICSKQIDISVKRFAVKYLIMIVSAFAAISGSTYVYNTSKIKTSMTDLRIPFTKEDSNAEFILNLIFQFNIFLHGSTVYIGLEVLVTIFENVMTVSPELLRFELQKLSVKQEKKKLSDQQMFIYFKNITKQALDIQK